MIHRLKKITSIVKTLRYVKNLFNKYLKKLLILIYINLYKAPLRKSTISEKTPKLSLYYRKMQQSLLFQNIYNFFKKDQVLTDF